MVKSFEFHQRSTYYERMKMAPVQTEPDPRRHFLSSFDRYMHSNPVKWDQCGGSVVKHSERSIIRTHVEGGLDRLLDGLEARNAVL